MTFHPEGNSYPIGPTLTPDGANFCLFSKNCEQVELLLFTGKDEIVPSKVIKLDNRVNRTGNYWHTFIPGIKTGQLYGYRVIGEFDPDKGHRFDREKILLDPYAKGVAIPEGFNRQLFTTTGAVNSPPMKSVVCDLANYDWEGTSRPCRAFAQTVIYELHVGGFTRHKNSGVSEINRGKYSGLIEKIPYLVNLGITAVELLPVFQFDVQDSPTGLINYWGYSPISFFAPHNGYARSNDPLVALNEFRDMVKALHKAGIEVILDVVFNHTAEGGINGPNYCFRGIDNSIYYSLDQRKSDYADYTGTGNTINANNPIVRRMIVDSLHFWAEEMQVDGFRFDLASILSRDEKGRPIENAPVLWDIDSDPALAGTKLIAEAWDAAGLYQVGSFIGDSWREWNGKFRDDVRSFFRGDQGTLSRFVTRTLGSPDLYESSNREPEKSINFVTCHDGFTLCDLVSYNSKHNEANGEGNRDGTNDNFSWNCGIEGPTSDEAITALRNRQCRNFLAISLLSVGAPMILMGDEVMRSQLGNNNAYCQDNELSWFDWDMVQKHSGLHRFVKSLIESRLRRDMARDQFNMSLQQLLSRAKFKWHGIKLNQPDWSEHSHAIAIEVESLSGSFHIHYMINASSQALTFDIPLMNGSRTWRRWIDTSLPSPDDIGSWEDGQVVPGQTYQLMDHSLAVLVFQSNPS
jgi:isoamylase